MSVDFLGLHNTLGWSVYHLPKESKFTKGISQMNPDPLRVWVQSFGLIVYKIRRTK